MRATKASPLNYSERISMTVPELAQALGVGYQTAHKIACESGGLFKIGKRVLVRRMDVEKYIETLTK